MTLVFSSEEKQSYSQKLVGLAETVRKLNINLLFVIFAKKSYMPAKK